MAINIDNADFRMFTDFAAAAKSSKSRAQLGGPTVLAGQPRTITAAKNWDFVGNIGRLSSQKATNDSVRQLFRDTIANMFGGEKHIPENVLKAMKLEDYGKGKPLTARRIKAVKTEVERFAQTVKATGDKAMDTLRPDGAVAKLPKAEVDALEKTVRGLLESCNNPDMLDVVSKSARGEIIRGICIRGNGTVRSEAEIKAKFDGILANLEEVKAAANGNQEILRAGKFMVDALGGRSMPPGRIGTLVKLATGDGIKMDAFKRLKSSPNPLTLARAAIQLRKNVDSVLDSAGITLRPGENEINTATKNFIARLMLQRLGKGTLRSIQTALTGESAIQLNNLADFIQRNKTLPIDKGALREAITGDRNTAIPADLQKELKRKTAILLSRDLSDMSNIIAEILDEEIPEIRGGDDLDTIPDDTLTILAEIKNTETSTRE
jgi:hypothetical protein